MALKQIKNKIRSVNKTRKVTKAMEAVSAVKMRKSQERAIVGRPYARAALTILKRVSGSREALSHELVAARPAVSSVALIIVSTDKGLCGGLNTALFKIAHMFMKEQNLSKESVVCYTLGRKATEHFSARGFRIVGSFPAPSEAITLDKVRELLGSVLSGYRAHAYDRVVVAYTNFRSTFEQEAVVRQLVPVSFDEVTKTVAGIVPEKGKYAEKTMTQEHQVATYTIEPSPESVLDALIPQLAAINLYHALLESAASEHSARMVAMKNASDKAAEVSRTLTLRFNKARQAIITREVSEIVGGMEVMR